MKIQNYCSKEKQYSSSRLLSILQFILGSIVLISCLFAMFFNINGYKDFIEYPIYLFLMSNGINSLNKYIEKKYNG